MSDGRQPARGRDLAAALALVCLAILAAWAAIRAESARIRNPGAAVVDAHGRVWVLAGSRCVLLDAGGAQVREWSAAELGVEPPFAGMAALADGGMAIGSYATGRVRFVDGEGRPGDEITVRRGRRPDGSFQLWYDAPRERMIVADNPNHRVAVFSRRGELLAESGPGDLRFPNGVGVDRQGRIVVADTNHYRIVVLDDSLREVKSLSFRDAWPFRYPVYVAFSEESGGLLATLHDNRLTRAELVRFDGDGRRVQTIALPPACRPGLFTLLDGSTLLPDRDGFRLLQLGSRDDRWSPFGRAPFTTTLENDRNEWRSFRRLAWAAVSGLGLLLLGLVGAYVVGRRRVSVLPDRSPIDAWTIEQAEMLGRTPSAGRIVVALILMVLAAVLVEMPRLGPERRLVLTAAALALIVLAGGLLLYSLVAERPRFRRQQLLTTVRRFRTLIGRLLEANERVLLCAVARPRLGERALLVLCEQRMFVLAHDVLRTQVRRLQEIPYASVRMARLAPASAQLLFDLPVRAATVALALAPEDARDVQRILAERAPRRGLPDDVYDRCPSCGRRWEPCPDCRRAPLGPRFAALVSAVVPGLGQIVNGAFLRGTLLLAVAGVLGLALIPPLRELARRSTEVSLIPIVKVGLILATVWALGVWDAWASGDANRRRWGIRVS